MRNRVISRRGARIVLWDLVARLCLVCREKFGNQPEALVGCVFGEPKEHLRIVSVRINPQEVKKAFCHVPHITVDKRQRAHSR